MSMQWQPEKIVDVLRSIMIFVLMLVLLTTLGVLFFAAH